MKIIAYFSAVALSCSVFAGELKSPDPLPGDLSAKVKPLVQEVEYQLLAVQECPFLVQVFHPTNPNVAQLGVCFYSHTETKGIYQHTACVGALVEPQSGIKNPFYGSKGHWGLEKKCDRDRLLKKLSEPEIATTVNPISDLKMKQKEGRRIRVLRDEFGIWETVKKLTTP